MNKTILIALAVALVTPFAAIADPDVLGVPDVTCQSPAEWRTHDYGAPATGSLVFLPQDGNLEECGTSTWFDPSGDECVTLGSGPVYDALCATDRAADWDGDYDFMFGGAYLVAVSGDGVTSGGLACFDVVGHHPVQGTVTVTDLSGLPTAFSVTADFTNPSSPVPADGPDCGDGVVEPCDPSPPAPSTLPPPVNDVVDIVNGLLYSLFNSDGTTCVQGDASQNCLGSCVVGFGPGADGSYTAFVGPTLSGSADGTPTVATGGHIHL